MLPGWGRMSHGADSIASSAAGAAELRASKALSEGVMQAVHLWSVSGIEAADWAAMVSRVPSSSLRSGETLPA